MALVVANGYAIIREFPAIQLITVGLVGLYVVFFHTDWAMYLVALSTPFSVIIRSKNIPLGLSLPSEALMGDGGFHHLSPKGDVSLERR